MRQINEAKARPTLPPIDATSLVAQQSLRGALVAATLVALCLNVIWLWLSNISGSFFHWYSVLQGPLIGLAVRHAGRGIDWRFPVTAAAVTMLAAFSGNFLVSLATTSAVLGASPLQVLRGLTVWSWQTWYAEVLTVVDLLYALFAAAVAAFYAKRRLRRNEVFALRSMKQESRR
ncbi:MAG: hypothetical protein RLN69_02635 [Woeseiaceae bacterium]